MERTVGMEVPLQDEIAQQAGPRARKPAARRLRRVERGLEGLVYGGRKVEDAGLRMEDGGLRMEDGG